MSRDSSRTYIHLHAPRHADLFEDFNTNPSSHPPTAAPTLNQLPTLSQPSTTRPAATGLPDEDIDVAPAHQPPNPEDEDDIVPDQHAAFGITQAMAQRERADRAWRDFDGLAGLVRGADLEAAQARGQGAARSAGYAGIAAVSGVSKGPLRK